MVATKLWGRFVAIAVAVPLFSLLVLPNAACATSENYAKQMQTWVGADINRLISAWGPPSNEYTMPNGHIMYTWLWVGGTKVVSNYNQYLNMTVSHSKTYWCKTTFTASPSGVIEKGQWEGNSCKS
jgi:hypothetical protein